MANVKIETNGAKGRVVIDGVEIPGVKSYTIRHEAGELPEMQLKVIAETLTIDGEYYPYFGDPVLTRRIDEMEKRCKMLEAKCVDRGMKVSSGAFANAY